MPSEDFESTPTNPPMPTISQTKDSELQRDHTQMLLYWLKQNLISSTLKKRTSNLAHLVGVALFSSFGLGVNDWIIGPQHGRLWLGARLL